MSGIFSYESRFSRVMNKIVDCFYASVLWIIACIPIVTIGTSTTALFTVARKTIRQDRGYVFQTFRDTFKAEFRQTTIMWLIQVAVYLVLAFGRMISRSFLEQGSPLGFMYYVYHYVILFEIEDAYELNTGKLIVDEFARMGKDPEAVSAVVCKNHGPFAWGRDPVDAVHSAVILEEVAKMARKR